MQYKKIAMTVAVVFTSCLFFTNCTFQRANESSYEDLGGGKLGISLSFDDERLRKATNERPFEWPEGKKMGLSLTFDDARISQADKGIPLFDKYNVKGTFYVSPENMVHRMDKWRKAAANGHEIGNHTLLHPCSGNFTWTHGRELENYNLEWMKEDLEAAAKIIRDSLGIDAVSFAYPCGQTFVGSGENTQSYVPLVASMFQTGRGWMDEGANDPVICDMSQLLGMEMDHKSFREIKRLIDTAKIRGKWLILVGHEMDNRGDEVTYLTTLEAICKYAMDPANEIWIDNVQNIASYVLEKREEMYAENDQ